MAKKRYISKNSGKFIYFQQILFQIKDDNTPLPKKLHLIKMFSDKVNDFVGLKTSGKNPKFNKLYKKIAALDEEFEKVYKDSVIPELEKQKITIKDITSLSDEQTKFVNEFFEKNIKPALTPYAINEDSVQSFFKDGQKYFGLETQAIGNEQNENQQTDDEEQKPVSEYILIEIPASIPKFVNLSQSGMEMISTEEIIALNLDKLLPERKISDFILITLRLKNEAENEWLLFLHGDTGNNSFKKLSKLFGIKKKNVFSELLYPHIIDSVSFANSKLTFKDEKVEPIVSSSLNKSSNIFETVSKQDVLLHFPYHSYEEIIKFFKQASNDPFVSEIKLTQSQLSQNPNIIVSLLNSVKTGKRVTIYADENSDTGTLNDFRESDINIISNAAGMEINCEVAMIKRRENDGEKNYVYFSTKNSDTKNYCADLGLLTGNEAISNDLNYFFNFLELGTKGFEFNELLVSGLNMKKDLTKLIENEIKNSEQGKDGYIMLKMNKLEDKKLIDLLSDASIAGVKIKLLVSETCLLDAEHWLNQNIQIRYLINTLEEHSRILIFYNDGEPVIYLTSSDWTKNDFSKKIEIALPVKHTSLRTSLVEIFNLYSRSTQNSVQNYIKSMDF